MGSSVKSEHASKHMKLLLTLASLVALGQAGDLESLLESKDAATKLLRSKRDIKGIDPDEWCKGRLASPECWHEFTELVWQPLRFPSRNQVKAKEGRKLYWCVVGCNLRDDAADWVGKAHEEKREKREEFLDAGLDLGQGVGKFYDACQQCCQHIPVGLRGLDKVKQSCPEFNSVEIQKFVKSNIVEPTVQAAPVESETVQSETDQSATVDNIEQ